MQAHIKRMWFFGDKILKRALEIEFQYLGIARV